VRHDQRRLVRTPQSAKKPSSSDNITRVSRLNVGIGVLGGTTTPSSLRIVPVPVPVAIVALLGADRLTVKVSFGSIVVSPATLTVIVCVVTPGANVSVPLVAA
jgi:hypothetical protein